MTLDHGTAVVLLGWGVFLAPIGLLCALGGASIIKRRIREEATARVTQFAILAGLAAAVGILVLMLLHDTRHESISVGEWVAIPHYHFSLELTFDRLSVPFVLLTFLLTGVISAFASRYMHRERGYHRFFLLFAIFLVGMVLTALAGTIETLFAGWELVGLSSALLVAFFQERPAPPRNALWVWGIYRISDAALLVAAIWLHHLQGEGDLNDLTSGPPWPESRAVVSGVPILGVGLLLILAAAGKSALVPFSGWLPRAMEGPTPSSAIFYGALSVHLGVYLLLRVSPLLETSAWLSGIVVCLGLATACYAYLVGSVQTDIKSILCFASLVQVGLIVAEIGVGLRYIALVHLLGNASLRTLQFLRAPTLLQDYRHTENAIGARLPSLPGPIERFPIRLRTWLYRFALERGYLDVIIVRCVVEPFQSLFTTLDRWERRWTDWLAGRSDATSVPMSFGKVEEMR